MKRLIFILIAALTVFAFAGCKEKDDGRRAMNIDYVTLENGASAKLMNGQAQEFFNVTATEPQTVEVSVEKISGELKIEIFNTENPQIMVYDGHDFPQSTFTVNVNDAGCYTILVTCEEFVGDYEFSYDLLIGN